MPRLFIGIPITITEPPVSKLKELAKATDSKLKIVDPGLYHLTLHFFGEVPDDKVQMINRLLSDVKVQQMKGKISSPGCFPTGQRKGPNVLHLKVESKELYDLAMRLRKLLQNNGFKVEKRPFQAHLTIARVKSSNKPKELESGWTEFQFTGQPIELSSFHLIESTLTPQGSIYTTLHSYSKPS